MTVDVAVEGDADLVVARRLLDFVGLQHGRPHVMDGKHALDTKVPAYAAAARHGRFFVLRDLDADAPCPGELVSRLAPERPAGLCLRVAVPQVEAWLIADSQAFSDFFRVPIGQIPTDPDLLSNAKVATVNLVRRSTKPGIRARMVPRPGSGRSIGPEYTSTLSEYTQTVWRPAIARRSSRSLARCISSLARLVPAPS